MAFQYITRSNQFWKLRQAQVRPTYSSYAIGKSPLFFGCDKTKVPDDTKNYSTDTKVQLHLRHKINSNVCDYNTLPSIPVGINFSYKHHHEHNHKEETCNSRSPILPAACLYLGAVLLGSSSVFCEAEENQDDNEEETCFLEPRECQACAKSTAHYFALQNCNRRPTESNICSSTLGKSKKYYSNASSSGNCASCRAHEEDFSSTLVKKLNNHGRIDHFPSHQIDCESQDMDVNLVPASSTMLHQNPAIHLDGKSDGDSSFKQKLQNAISRSTAILKSKLIMSGAVGASVAVMLDGELVWSQGMGYCHVESATACSCHSKYRIASISKSITATIAMALWEDGLLDLDAPISKYLPDWPIKTVNGKEVTITSRQLLTHTSGIRHYFLKKPEVDNSENSGDSGDKEEAPLSDTEKQKKSGPPTVSEEKQSGEKTNASQENKPEDFKKYVKSRREALIPQLNHYKVSDEMAKQNKDDEDGNLLEYYINKPYSSVSEAIDLFKDDDLFFTPGSGFLYTSHGYVLLSRVLEAASGVPFPQLAKDFFENVGLSQTQLDTTRDIVPRRVSCYERDEGHELRNAPQVNNSYKWAGGGFLSSAVDLVRLGSVLLYSLHATEHMIQEHNVQPGFLKASTVQKMWSPYFYHRPSKAFTRNFIRGYGLGWSVQVPRMDQYDKKAFVSPGASSGNGSVSGNEEEDESFVRISTPWGPSRRRSAHVPAEPEVAQSEGAPGDDGDEVIEQGSNLTADPETQDMQKLPGVKSAIQKVSKSVPNTKASPGAKVKRMFPETVVESSGWVEGDPIGGRNCRGCCRCGGFAAYHSGAAVGGSSILLIMPQPPGDWLVQKHQDGADDADQSGDACSCNGKDLNVHDSEAPHLKTTDTDSRNSDEKKKNSEEVPYRSVMASRSSWNRCRWCESKRDGEVEASTGHKEEAEVQGVVVAILSNHTGVSFGDEAFKIAKEFSAIAS